MVDRIIKLSNGKHSKKKYYYWDSFKDKESAKIVASNLCREMKIEGINLKYFITEAIEGILEPITVFRLYLNRRMKIL